MKKNSQALATAQVVHGFKVRKETVKKLQVTNKKYIHKTGSNVAEYLQHVS